MSVRVCLSDCVLSICLSVSMPTRRPAGLRKVYHTGSYSSYNCRLTLLPDVSVGVWACVSSPGDNRGVTAAKLVNQFALDLLLGKILFGI